MAKDNEEPSFLFLIVDPHLDDDNSLKEGDGLDACRNFIMPSPTLSKGWTPVRLYRLRFLVFVYVLFIYLFTWFYTPIDLWWKYYTQLTNLSWIGILIYFGSSSLLGWYACRKSVPQGDSMNSTSTLQTSLSLSKWMKWIIWNLYIVQATFQWIVVLVWWSMLSRKLLSEPRPIPLFLTCNVHGMGLVFMIMDACVNSIPIYYSQWTGVTLVMLLYSLYTQLQHEWFSYLTSEPDGYWAYPFLNRYKAGWYYWYIGLVFGFLFVFFLVASAHKLRDGYRKRKFCKATSRV